MRTFAGTAPGAGFGSALAALPDLDGDGLQDLAIGIPGGTRGEVVIVATASTATLRRHTGPAGIPGFGSVLAEVGDLDGDGKVDLAVGVPDAYANGVVVTYSSATGALLHAILGRAPGDRFGASLAAAGDVDRDGKADFAVGSPGADAGTQLELGRVEVFSGATGALRVAVLGTTPGGSSGASLAALGDVDGDGRAELAVGAPAADAGLVTLLAPHDLAIAATPLTLPLASGGAQRLEIDFGTAAAGHTYLVLGSAQGIDPGVTIGSVHVPLVPDGYLLGLLLAPNQPPLTASFGPLSVAGTGVTTFTLPASLPPVFLGLTLHHAALHFDGARLVAASSAVPVQLVGTATGVRTAGEEFASANQLDLARSSGSWSAGQARTGTLGGDGILGDFQASDGRSLGAGVYEWNTDSQRIPGARTLTGKDIDVTDGVFRFATFHVPAGTTVRFVGSQPARILVRGSVTVAGIVESNGQTTQMVDTASANGQPGSRGGAGGGAGGQGSDRCTGLGYEPRFDGQAGGDVGLLPGHAYAARAVGTGGRGSRVFPTAATNASVTFKYQGNQACGMVPAAGGSGGARSAGGVGRATLSPSNELGPQAAGGSAFDPFPLPPFVASFEHFLVAGAGGGGGGSHPFYSYAVTGVRWRAGGAGGGGGGALGFRVGSRPRDLGRGHDLVPRWERTLLHPHPARPRSSGGERRRQRWFGRPPCRRTHRAERNARRPRRDGRILGSQRSERDRERRPRKRGLRPARASHAALGDRARDHATTGQHERRRRHPGPSRPGLRPALALVPRGAAPCAALRALRGRDQRGALQRRSRARHARALRFLGTALVPRARCKARSGDEGSRSRERARDADAGGTLRQR